VPEEVSWREIPIALIDLRSRDLRLRNGNVLRAFGLVATMIVPQSGPVLTPASQLPTLFSRIECLRRWHLFTWTLNREAIIHATDEQGNPSSGVSACR
jgi:hypothetical protein